MAFPNLSEIVTTTLRSRTGELADNMSRNNALLALGLLGFVFGVYSWTRHRVKDMDVFADKADELDEVRLVKSELAAKGIKMNSDAPPLK